MPSRNAQTILRLPAAVREDLEQYARDNDLTVNTAAIRLLRAGIEAEERAFTERFGPLLRQEIDKVLAERGQE